MPDSESIYQEAGYDNWDDYEANDFRTVREIAIEEAAEAARERQKEREFDEARTAMKAQDAYHDQLARIVSETLNKADEYLAKYK